MKQILPQILEKSPNNQTDTRELSLLPIRLPPKGTPEVRKWD
jgi:hypothetical protein